MNDRRLSPLARRRREIIADVELIISYLMGALTAAGVVAFLRALGVM